MVDFSHGQTPHCYSGIMETDLVQIRVLGEKKRAENERFRKHLKSRDHSDRILRRIAEKVEDAIDCTTCANCCRLASVRLSERDVARLATYLRIPSGSVSGEIYDGKRRGRNHFGAHSGKWLRISGRHHLLGIRCKAGYLPALSPHSTRRRFPGQPYVAVN